MPDTMFCDRFIDMLCPEGGLIMLIEGYFDASGLSDPARVVSVGGYLFDAEKVKGLNAQWEQFLSPHLEGLPEAKQFFRMTAFMDHRPPWRDMGEAAWLSLRRQLVDSVKDSAIAGFLVAVKREDFAGAQTQVKSLLGNPYMACATAIMESVSQHVRGNHTDSRIAYVFESGDAGQDRFSSFLDSVEVSQMARDRYCYGSHSFASKSAGGHALAAADMLVWEYRKAIEDDILDAKLEDAPRIFFNSILEKPMMMAYLHPANLATHAMVHKWLQFEMKVRP